MLPRRRLGLGAEVEADPVGQVQCEENLALELTDRIGLSLAPEAEAAARQHFRTAARYEWMFWDAAYRQETWPV